MLASILAIINTLTLNLPNLGYTGLSTNVIKTILQVATCQNKISNPIEKLIAIETVIIYILLFYLFSQGTKIIFTVHVFFFFLSLLGFVLGAFVSDHFF